jgi:channel protein (hemolysin III family)
VDSGTPIYSIPGFADPVSSLTHLLGAAIFAVLAVPLLRRARGNAVHVALLSVFAFASVLLLSMSGVYHLLPHDWAGRSVMQRLDHAAIFVLIAASFAPPHGILFRGFHAWGPIIFVWILATAGITLKMIYFDSLPDWIGVLVYLGFGWIGLFSGVALWRRFGFRFVQPLLWGALGYTIGAILHMARWPVLVPGVFASHELFHLGVLAGVGFHWQFMVRIADWQETPLEDNAALDTPIPTFPDLAAAAQEA